MRDEAPRRQYHWDDQGRSGRTGRMAPRARAAVQRPEAQARRLRRQLQLRRQHQPRADHLQGDLGAHPRDRQARRCDGLRARAAGGALARLRRHHRLQRRIVRDLHLGGGPGASDEEHHGGRDQPCADGASDRRCQAGDDHRPYLQRPVRPQPGHGLVHAGNGDVRRHAAGARRSLPLRRRVARHRQAPVDRGGTVRFRTRPTSTSGRPRRIPSRSRSRTPC